MRNFTELFFYGVVDLLFAVTVDIAPHGGNTIDVFFAINVLDKNTASFFNNQGRFFAVILHLGEGMPEVLLVPGL